MSRLRRWRVTERGASFLLTSRAKRGGASAASDEGAETTMKRGEWRVTPSFSRRIRSVLRLRRFGWLSTQFFAANGAAATDDLASGLGRHSGPKTVFASVFDLFWLVNSFWHGERYFSRKIFLYPFAVFEIFPPGKNRFLFGYIGGGQNVENL